VALFAAYSFNYSNLNKHVSYPPTTGLFDSDSGGKMLLSVCCYVITILLTISILELHCIRVIPSIEDNSILDGLLGT